MRVGAVPYLVAKPLIEGLDGSGCLSLTLGTPAELVRGLREETLDVALASSIEAFRSPGYTVIPDLAIGSDGEVMSVRLFLRRQWAAVRRVALDSASESGAALLRILLAERLPHPVEWVRVGPREDPACADADAYLRIGDGALREVAGPSRLESWDLGAAWKERTGLPFVFALWLVRPGFGLGPAFGLFGAAASRGLAMRRGLALAASRSLGVPFPFLCQYLLEACRYRLGERELRALREFRDRAARLDLCRGDLEICLARG